MLKHFNPYAVFARVQSLESADRSAIYSKLELSEKQRKEVERRIQLAEQSRAVGSRVADSIEHNAEVPGAPRNLSEGATETSASPPVAEDKAKFSENEQVTISAEQVTGQASQVELGGYQHLSVPGYELIRKIGDGGQAIVFLATQHSTGRRVAVKLLRDGPLAHENSRERHQREIRILATMNHANIVGIVDSGRTAAGNDYLVMEYIHGESLDDYMRNFNHADPGDPAAILRLFIKICEAVNAAHRRGIVHRDLSPSNIRVDDKGDPHILDFGLARTAFDRFMHPDGRDISVSGQFLGKLAYASPEQARGKPEAVDIRTDVYALGVMLYQTLTGGKFPYIVVGNIRDVLDNIVNIQPTPPSRVLDAGLKRRVPRRKTRMTLVNPVVEAIVLKALAKNPIKRHQSAGELATGLETYLAGGPIKPAYLANEGGWKLRRLFGFQE